jgi:hypothetical protein
MTFPNKHAPWTPAELKRLRECYPIMTLEKLGEELPRHSASSIVNRVKRLKLRKGRDWKAICANHKPVVLRFGGKRLV